MKVIIILRGSSTLSQIVKAQCRCIRSNTKSSNIPSFKPTEINRVISGYVAQRRRNKLMMMFLSMLISISR